jgi:hypothetical protein
MFIHAHISSKDRLKIPKRRAWVATYVCIAFDHSKRSNSFSRDSNLHIWKSFIVMALKQFELGRPRQMQALFCRLCKTPFEILFITVYHRGQQHENFKNCFACVCTKKQNDAA